jgi:hypothetical protein
MPRQGNKGGVQSGIKGVSPDLKRELQAEVWDTERRRASNELHEIRWSAGKRAGQMAVDAHIKKKKWGKYEGKNPYGKTRSERLNETHRRNMKLSTRE